MFQEATAGDMGGPRVDRSGIGCLIVTSASRGVGVSSVALHLAAVVASRRGTCLVDLDRTWRGASARLGLPEDRRTWADCDGSEASFRSCALPVKGGFRFVSSPIAEATTRIDASSLLDVAASCFPNVVVDLPADAPGRDAVLESADGFLVVVAPSSEGVKRAAQAASSLPQAPTGFILNRLGGGSDLPTTELAQRLGHRIAAELPCTPALRDAEDDHLLLDRPWSRWTRRLNRVAAALERAADD